MKNKLDFREFQKYIAKDKSIKREIFDIVEPKIKKSKEKLIQSFNTHPVSTEISSGPEGANQSGTLGGYGNLFSFIGFASSNPVKEWVSFINRVITLNSSIKTSVSGNAINFSLTVNGISSEDLKSIAPMPWESGRSWIEAIEGSISGFSFYVSRMGAGRSGGGVQSNFPRKGKISYKSVPYWSKMWNEFLKDIQQ